MTRFLKTTLAALLAALTTTAGPVLAEEPVFIDPLAAALLRLAEQAPLADAMTAAETPVWATPVDTVDELIVAALAANFDRKAAEVSITENAATCDGLDALEVGLAALQAAAGLTDVSAGIADLDTKVAEATAACQAVNAAEATIASINEALKGAFGKEVFTASVSNKNGDTISLIDALSVAMSMNRVSAEIDNLQAENKDAEVAVLRDLVKKQTAEINDLKEAVEAASMLAANVTAFCTVNARVSICRAAAIVPVEAGDDGSDADND